MTATEYRERSQDTFAEGIVRRLPRRVPGKLLQELDCYGIRRVIGSAVGITPHCPSETRWVHGWQWDPISCAEQLAPLMKPTTCRLVATSSHAELLQKHGYSNVHAVGLPILYVAQPKVTRMPRSILVMPPHSLAWTEHNWGEADYVQYLLSIRSRFSSILACVSGSCVDRGYWCNAFEKAGIPWVRGAEPADQNALLRMRTLFGMFEFVTTNNMGSHVAYAALSGCRVSIAGPYCALNAASYKNDKFFQQYPEVLEANIFRSSEVVVKQYYPTLFFEPNDAKQHVSWAEKALGKDCMRPPREIAKLLGWPSNRNEILRYHVRGIIRKSPLLKRVIGVVLRGIRAVRKQNGISLLE